jgi:hypothetical protein
VVYVGWTLLVLGALAVARDPHRARAWALGAAVAMLRQTKAALQMHRNHP